MSQLTPYDDTILGGMYSLTSLNNFPTTKTLIVYGIQIIVIMFILLVGEKRISS